MNSIIKTLELFSGAGGLALGVERAGTSHVGLLEWDSNACNTLTANFDSAIVQQTDIRMVDYTQFSGVGLITGGPPCQPFSMGGKHQGQSDSRDMFPYACKAISTCLPKAFIFENVKGLLRDKFSDYLEYIIMRLTYPEEIIREFESWQGHFLRLKKIHKSGSHSGIKYDVIYRLVDAADYGIPQCRKRVFIIGIRDDLKVEWHFPAKTHSLDALLWEQFISHKYWEKHEIAPTEKTSMSPRYRQRVDIIESSYGLFPPEKLPWQTVRDVLVDIPEPDGSFWDNAEHVFRDGARSYPGHTGSFIDLPSKTLKAGDHGVPGGENMIRYRNGRVRYYTVFEAKRIQTFPDNYRIQGPWTEAMRQLGNAVPVDLGYIISKSVVEAVWSDRQPRRASVDSADNRAVGVK